MRTQSLKSKKTNVIVFMTVRLQSIFYFAAFLCELRRQTINCKVKDYEYWELVQFKGG